MKIVIATYYDWDALYVDGINKLEEHTLYIGDLSVALKDNLPCTIESFEVKSVDEKWWCDRLAELEDNYPDKIEDVIFE